MNTIQYSNIRCCTIQWLKIRKTKKIIFNPSFRIYVLWIFVRNILKAQVESEVLYGPLWKTCDIITTLLWIPHVASSWKYTYCYCNSCIIVKGWTSYSYVFYYPPSGKDVGYRWNSNLFLMRIFVSQVAACPSMVAHQGLGPSSLVLSCAPLGSKAAPPNSMFSLVIGEFLRGVSLTIVRDIGSSHNLYNLGIWHSWLSQL